MGGGVGGGIFQGSMYKVHEKAFPVDEAPRVRQDSRSVVRLLLVG